ncbi:MAG: hypothetical protein ACFB2W_06230 [Leptolyngbyaceae cyanobacterium]
MHFLNPERWQRLCQQLTIQNQSAISQEFERIAAAYQEPQRAYHTAQHINECLAIMDGAALTLGPHAQATLEMALWYHDLVYQPQKADNEQQSAVRASTFLRANGVSDTLVEEITLLVMATCHSTPSLSKTKTALTDWIVDIDLAILGAAPQRFTQYEAQIRQEYAWVPISVYRSKRIKVLTQFLESAAIYRSSFFQQRFEAQARENLLNLVIALRPQPRKPVSK